MRKNKGERTAHTTGQVSYARFFHPGNGPSAAFRINGRFTGWHDNSCVHVTCRIFKVIRPAQLFWSADQMYAQLIGPFRLLDDQDVIRTPHGAKARALVAALALSPANRRPRRWIEALLWSDRAPEQASGSLRQALMDIRLALGPSAGALHADRETVGLLSLRTDVGENPDAARRALEAGREPLEGVSVRDPAFLRWLAEQRERLQGRPLLPAVTAEHAQRAIPLLVHREDAGTGAARFAATVLAEGIGKLVSDCALVEAFSGGLAASRLGPKDQGLSLKVCSAQREGRIHLSASLESLRSGQIFWSRQTGAAGGALDEVMEHVIPGMIYDAADAVMAAMPKLVVNDPTPIRAEGLIARAVRALFTFEAAQLRLADDLLREAAAIAPSARCLAWRGIARQFMVTERTESDRARLRDEAGMFSRRAIEGAPTNSLVLSLMSTLAIMLQDDVPAGIALATHAISLNPQNAFAYVAQAGSLMRQGRPDEAYSAADKGAKLAARSGFLHWWDMHKGLAATQMGEYATAISCFEAARARAPSFRAPLRQLVVLYRQSGEPDQAHRVMAHLKRLEPGFSPQLVHEDADYPMAMLGGAERRALSHAI